MTAATEEAPTAGSAPAEGQLVTVRNRVWVVSDVARSTIAPQSMTGSQQHAVTLISIEDDARDECAVAGGLAAVQSRLQPRILVLPKMVAYGGRPLVTQQQVEADLDTMLDCTSGADTVPVLLGVDALKRREGTLLIQGELAAFPDFPVRRRSRSRARGDTATARASSPSSSSRPAASRSTCWPRTRSPRRGGPRDQGDRRHRHRRGRHPRVPAAVAGLTMGTVYRTVSRADRAVADAFAEYGVATADEARGHRALLALYLNAERGARYVD